MKEMLKEMLKEHEAEAAKVAAIMKATDDDLRSRETEAKRQRERAYKETAAALFRSGSDE